MADPLYTQECDLATGSTESWTTASAKAVAKATAVALLAATEAHDEAQCAELFPVVVERLRQVTAGLTDLERILEEATRPAQPLL